VANIGKRLVAMIAPPDRFARICLPSNVARPPSGTNIPALRNAEVIRTDHYRALGGLIRQAPEGKQDPRQKKERGKGQQNKN
jgi:hypothetical protein